MFNNFFFFKIFFNAILIDISRCSLVLTSSFSAFFLLYWPSFAINLAITLVLDAIFHKSHFNVLVVVSSAVTNVVGISRPLPSIASFNSLTVGSMSRHLFLSTFFTSFSFSLRTFLSLHTNEIALLLM